MPEPLEFDSVEWISAGAIGEPGRRTFYVQARQGGELVALLVEKAQVAGLAELAQELLARFDVTVTPDDLDEQHHRLIDGIEPLWRAGEITLGASSDGERFMLELHELVLVPDELPDEALAGPPGEARFWMTRPQLVRLAAYAAFAVAVGARERCRLCGRPIEPDGTHTCPATNGHGKLTV